MAWEVGHVGALLQIPDLDLGISRPSAKNETIGVELSTSESCTGQTETLPPGTGGLFFTRPNTQVNIEALTTASTFISDFGEDSTSLDIREGPVLHNSEDKGYELVR